MSRCGTLPHWADHQQADRLQGDLSGFSGPHHPTTGQLIPLPAPTQPAPASLGVKPAPTIIATSYSFGQPRPSPNGHWPTTELAHRTSWSMLGYDCLQALLATSIETGSRTPLSSPSVVPSRRNKSSSRLCEGACFNPACRTLSKSRGNAHPRHRPHPVTSGLLGGEHHGSLLLAAGATMDCREAAQTMGPLRMHQYPSLHHNLHPHLRHRRGLPQHDRCRVDDPHHAPSQRRPQHLQPNPLTDLRPGAIRRPSLSAPSPRPLHQQALSRRSATHPLGVSRQPQANPPDARRTSTHG